MRFIMTRNFGRSFSRANGVKVNVGKTPAVCIFTLCLAASFFPAQPWPRTEREAPRLADHVTIGAGASVLPTFEGSDSTRVLPLPVIDIRQGIFVANTIRGSASASR
jgi:outer membrane scaffolding protein for murein synthesis (MipA/OmpV family)